MGDMMGKLKEVCFYFPSSSSLPSAFLPKNSLSIDRLRMRANRRLQLGNGILKPFGLSTDNFKLTKDETSGGYSMQFNQSGS